jgi:hypothetical protein
MSRSLSHTSGARVLTVMCLSSHPCSLSLRVISQLSVLLHSMASSSRTAWKQKAAGSPGVQHLFVACCIVKASDRASPDSRGGETACGPCVHTGQEPLQRSLEFLYHIPWLLVSFFEYGNLQSALLVHGFYICRFNHRLKNFLYVTLLLTCIM